MRPILICLTTSLLLLLGAHASAYAQDVYPEVIPVSKTDKRRLVTPLTEPRPLALSASYYGESLTHTGISVGVERELSTVLITKRRPRPFRAKQRIRQRFLIGHFTTYHHPKNHLATMAMAGFGVRHINRWHEKLELLTTLGYMHQFQHGTTYVVDDDGQLQARRVAHAPKLAWQLALGFGQDFSKRAVAPTPWAWHVRPGVLLEIPHNTTILPRLTLEAGIIYRLGAR